MSRQIRTPGDLMQTFTVPPAATAGHAVGIIAVDLVYPKLPGNVVNATTFAFPVIYRTVRFDIERLFAGDPAILDEVLAAARELEAQGVRAIFGACGYFAHFQAAVAEAVAVPVFLSSLLQLPMIRLGLKKDQRIAVFAANGEALSKELLASVGATRSDLAVIDVGHLESFAPIRRGRTTLDNGRLTQDLAELARKLDPDIGAILLECSDLPPYAWAIGDASGLPVFDFNSLINWAAQAALPAPYYGYL